MSVSHHLRPLSAAAGLAALALTAGAALSTPVPAAQAAPVPSGDVASQAKSHRSAGARNLPVESTMTWLEAGDWTSEGTTRSTEPTSTTPCTTRVLNDYRGARATTWERSFIRGSDGSARAVLVLFDTAKHAKAAERAVTRQLQHCDDTLVADASYDQVGEPGPVRPVTTKVGSARFTEMSYQSSADDEAGPDSWTFDDTGTVRAGRRLLVITMKSEGQDSNWSHVANDPTGLPLHPLYLTLPAAAKRLAR